MRRPSTTHGYFTTTLSVETLGVQVAEGLEVTEPWQTKHDMTQECCIVELVRNLGHYCAEGVAGLAVTANGMSHQ